MAEPSKSGEYVVFNDPPTSSNHTTPRSPNPMADKMTLIDVRDWHRFSQQAAEADGHDNAAGAHKELADALDAHIAAMGEPVAWQFQGTDGTWRGFTNERHRINTIEDGRWPIRALYLAPPASGDWDKVRAAVPTSWLDPMLTGPHAVIGKGPYDGGDIERVLGAVRQRLTAALPESQP